jgi:t-SNARE complex subunit (syntaxin)
MASTNSEQINILNSINKVNSFELEQEFNNEMKNLLSEVQEINDINLYMNELILSQTDKINNINHNIDKTVNVIEKSNDQLILASNYQRSLLWKKGILLTACTAVVTMPVTFFVGANIGLIAGIGTFIAGGITIINSK